MSHLNNTFREMYTLFENDTRQCGTNDSARMLCIASILLCQRELTLNGTNDRKKQYFERFRAVSEQSSPDSIDDSSAYVYDNSTSELICLVIGRVVSGWWRGTVVERRSLAGELSLSCARPAADG